MGNECKPERIGGLFLTSTMHGLSFATFFFFEIKYFHYSTRTPGINQQYLITYS